MRINTQLLYACILGAMLSACEQYDGVMSGGGLTKQDVGTVAGAIGGGVVGSTIGSGSGKTAATIGGALLGGWLGSSIGSSLDNADMAHYNQTSQRAMESGHVGESFPWENPQSGHSGTVTPLSRYRNSDGNYCRKYNQTITIGGKTEQASGRACRQADGTWRVVE